MKAGYVLGDTSSPIRDKSYAFTLQSVRLARDLRAQREYDLASQVLRARSSEAHELIRLLTAIVKTTRQTPSPLDLPN